MSAGLIAGLVAGGASLLSIASFFIARMKDAEERGAMKQKIKDLEDRVNKMGAEMGCQGAQINEQNVSAAAVSQRLDAIEDKIKSIDSKLDRLLDRQAAGRPV